MQSFEILLNRGFSATTKAQKTQDISSFGEYFVYNESIGGGVVSQFNVRAFMNDGRNQFIVQDFIAYLTGSTTESEITQILGSNQMLSNIFNEYYQTSVLSGQQTTTAVINTNLVDTVTISIVEHDFNWNGIAIDNVLDHIPKGINQATRINEVYNKNIKTTEEDSYYLPIVIKRNYDETRIKYKLCDEKISLIVEPHLGKIPIEELEKSLSNPTEQNLGVTEGVSKRFPPDPPTPFGFTLFKIFSEQWETYCFASVTNQTEFQLCQWLSQAVALLSAAYPTDPSFVESFFPVPFNFQSTLVGLVEYLIYRGRPVTLSSYDFINSSGFSSFDSPMNSTHIIGEIGSRTPNINYVYLPPISSQSGRSASRSGPNIGGGFIINQGSLDPAAGKEDKGGKTK